jgi:hypothetical protein
MENKFDNLELQEFYQAELEVTPMNIQKLAAYKFGGRSKLEQQH